MFVSGKPCQQFVSNLVYFVSARILSASLRVFWLFPSIMFAPMWRIIISKISILESSLWLTLFYMGGRIFPPGRLSLSNHCWMPHGLIFHDFVPSKIRKVLDRPFLEIVLKISKILASTIFSELNPKGGPFYAKVKKVEKVKFFCSKSYFFYLNMNYKCSKPSIEVSDMSYNQFLVILRTFL